MRTLLGLLFLLAVPMSHAQDKSQAVAAKMREAAEKLLAALPAATRDKVQRPFEDADRLDWHYTPRSRNGAALKELDARGREAVHGLLKAALSAEGYRK